MKQWPHSFLFVGAGGHGKDTACQIFSGITLLKNAGGTSLSIYPAVAKLLGFSVAEIIARKREFRPYLANKGDELREGNPARLAMDRLEVGPIVNGVRRIEELNECIRLELFTDYIWIEADTVGPDSTLTFEFSDLPTKARYRVLNKFGDLAPMTAQLYRIARNRGVLP